MGLCATKEEQEFEIKRRIAARTLLKKNQGTQRSGKDIEMDDFMQVFRDYERNGKRYLTRGEMRELLEKLFRKYGNYSSREDEEYLSKIIEAFIKRIDVNNDGNITKE